MTISPLRPLHYNLFLVSTTCRNCGWSAQSQEITLAHGDGNGVAFTNPERGTAPRFDIPIRQLYVERTLPWCYDCVAATSATSVPSHLLAPFDPSDFA